MLKSAAAKLINNSPLSANNKEKTCKAAPRLLWTWVTSPHTAPPVNMDVSVGKARHKGSTLVMFGPWWWWWMGEWVIRMERLFHQWRMNMASPADEAPRGLQFTTTWHIVHRCTLLVSNKLNYFWFNKCSWSQQTPEITLLFCSLWHFSDVNRVLLSAQSS